MKHQDYEGRTKRYGESVPDWMHKVPETNWYKEKWDKVGRWYNYKGKTEIAISDGFAGNRHIFRNGQTIKVVKTKGFAEKFVQKYMKQHPNG
jgi:hypothetical protein